jgi:excisionase family DNA binding protein
MQTETAPMARSEWLDVAGAAKEIDAGKRTIRAAIQSGGLRACAINSRGDIRIHRSWLMDWMSARSERG